jgi:hypothetical protein
MPKHFIKLIIGTPHVDQEYQSIKLANKEIAGELSYAIRTLADAHKGVAGKKAAAKKVARSQSDVKAIKLHRPKKSSGARFVGQSDAAAKK